MEISGTHHIALLTTDLARMRQFYVETLGLPELGGFPGRPIIFIGVGDTAIELIEREGWEPSTAGNWQHLTFEVPDLDATHAELTAKGIAFHIAPRDVPAEQPVTRIAFFRDPDGNELELFQPIGSRYPQP